MGLFVGTNHLIGSRDPTLVTTRKEQLANMLRADIRDGRLKPGEHLPTEDQLMKQTSFSRSTVRGALALLVREGLIERRPKVGSIVRDSKILVFYAVRAGDPAGHGYPDSFLTETRDQGQTPRENFSYLEVPATPDLARPLDVREGSDLVLRRLVRLVDDRPSSLQDSYYPADIADRCGLRDAEMLEEGVVERMSAHGVREIGWRHDIGARNPTPEEASVLQLATGVPLVIHINLAGAKLNDPGLRGKAAHRWVRLTRTIFAGHSNIIRYELGDLEAMLAVHPEMRVYLP